MIWLPCKEQGLEHRYIKLSTGTFTQGFHEPPWRLSGSRGRLVDIGIIRWRLHSHPSQDHPSRKDPHWSSLVRGCAPWSLVVLGFGVRRRSLNTLSPITRASHKTFLNFSSLLCKLGTIRSIGTWSHTMKEYREYDLPSVHRTQWTLSKYQSPSFQAETPFPKPLDSGWSKELFYTPDLVILLR